jgi:hypothetical protein
LHLTCGYTGAEVFARRGFWGDMPAICPANLLGTLATPAQVAGVLWQVARRKRLDALLSRYTGRERAELLEVMRRNPAERGCFEWLTKGQRALVALPEGALVAELRR